MFLRRFNRFSRTIARVTACTALLSALPLVGSTQAPGPSMTGPNPLITGKKISLPQWIEQQNVGSLPMNLILSPNGQYVLSSDMGYRQSLWSLRVLDGKGIAHLDFPGGAGISNPADAPKTNGLYYGLATAPNVDGSATLYAAQGQNDSIAVVKLGTDGSLALTGSIKTRKGDFPSGLALDSRGYLYVANNDSNNFSLPSSLAIYNTISGVEVGRFTFTSANNTPNFPLAVAVLADGSKVYVSSQRDSAVYVLNTSDPTNPTLKTTISTGAHPISLLLDKAQAHLFVANAHSDTVSVVNTGLDTIADTILLRPTGAEDIAGATPNGLALSPDEQQLFVSLGDMNAVAVVSLKGHRLSGYIPAGWYPTAVAAGANNRLLFANAKGTSTRYPNPGYRLGDLANPYYVLNQIEGNVAILTVPSPPALRAYTRQVLRNNRITARTARTAHPPNPLAGISINAANGIKHVIYIIKENRTYDQVLGDLPQGNGAPALVLFGQKVTPNQHALAARFVLLDNFYDCGEASGDGWPWSTQGQANEYVIRNLPYNYSGRGRQYDFEGANNDYPVGGFPALGPNHTPLSDVFPNGMPPIPDVAEAPGGHIWDQVEKAGLSFRNYGFFLSFGVKTAGKQVIPENYPSSPGLQPGGHDLAGHSDFDFRRFDGDYADSDAPQIYFAQTNDPNCLYARTTFGKHNAPSRFAEWKTEFQEMLANDPTGNSVPAFMTVRFPNDHTQGYTPGKHSPQSEVADNDYAIGQLVEAISNSPIWKSTAIFIVEDDAQDGPDHVDAHRSTCYVISPFIKKGSVDHTFYNTDSVLKTMELLLRLPPMNQYDAVATPILDFDSAPRNEAVYTAILPDKPLIAQTIPKMSQFKPGSPAYQIAALSAKMDFVHPDSAPAGLLNQILWQSVKGVNSRMPAPRHNVQVTLANPDHKAKPARAVKDEDDD